MKFAKVLEFTCYNAQAWRLGTRTYELYNILMSNFPALFSLLKHFKEPTILKRNYFFLWGEQPSGRTKFKSNESKKKEEIYATFHRLISVIYTTCLCALKPSNPRFQFIARELLINIFYVVEIRSFTCLKLN